MRCEIFWQHAVKKSSLYLKLFWNGSIEEDYWRRGGLSKYLTESIIYNIFSGAAHGLVPGSANELSVPHLIKLATQEITQPL